MFKLVKNTALKQPEQLPNFEPGISYHAQIYPLAQGYDLRVHLYSVGFVAPGNGVIQLSKPTASTDESVPVDWSYRTGGSSYLQKVGDDFRLLGSLNPVDAVAEKYKDGRTYVAGTLTVVKPEGQTVGVLGLKEVRSIMLTQNTYAFAGWTKSPGRMAVVMGGSHRYPFTPRRAGSGPEAAQVWAQERLSQDSWPNRNAVLKFSLKYHIPSQVTALLAVPKEEMRIFKKKETEYRRQELENARRQREWASKKTQNWNRSKGGDPEIRVSFPAADKVYAVLPDGKVLNLRESGGYWGTNFEIPATAPEGSYSVRVYAIDANGARDEMTIQYKVLRTAPTGKTTMHLAAGRLVIEVKSEPGLNEVAAYEPNGIKHVLPEVEPGLYRTTMEPRTITLNVVLKDGASNKTEMRCSWQP